MTDVVGRHARSGGSGSGSGVDVNPKVLSSFLGDFIHAKSVTLSFRGHLVSSSLRSGIYSRTDTPSHLCPYYSAKVFNRMSIAKKTPNQSRGFQTLERRALESVPKDKTHTLLLFHVGTTGMS